MFSLYEGFIGLISKREISLDQTYLNFAQSLAIPTLKDIEKNPLKDAINLLEKELNFKVIQKNGRFYIQNESGELEAHLVAEGLRKLASILYLILNGEINKYTILFWDEPESNLNPALIKVVAKFIITLQKHGIQIFIATHDYLLTHILSLYSEYSDDKALPVCFFSLTKEDADIIIEKGYTLSEIENNSILDEYAAYYDLQHKFMTGNYE